MSMKEKEMEKKAYMELSPSDRAILTAMVGLIKALIESRNEYNLTTEKKGA